ncbi:MAG: T9SS type A sorting domain-containing protein [Bacteroidota bacterium]
MKKITLLSITLFIMQNAMAQVSITTASTPYTENFNTLNTSGGWSNNSTLAGWYSTESFIYLDNGASTIGGRFFSYGTNSSPERALGGSGFSSLAGVRFGVKLLNNTGDSITSLDISYMGEQWRVEAPGEQVLRFDYQIGATSLTTGTWTPVTQLDFNSPQPTGTTGAIDGNLPANQTYISYTLADTINPGESVWLRWTKWGGTSPGLSVDSFAVTANNNSPVGINEMQSNTEISIYPNPNNGNFQLTVPTQNSENATIKIFNVFGERVFIEQLEKSANNNILLSDLSNGIYFVNILSDNKSYTQKLIINK